MLHPDLKEFVALLTSHRVDFLVVGAHAVAFHARPRFTGDLDVFIRATDENAQKVLAALDDFGFGSLSISTSDLTKSNNVIQLGYEPHRIDIATSISGVSFEDVWNEKEEGELSGIAVYFPSKRHLIINKESTGREKDLIDLIALRRVKDSKL